MTNSFIFQKTFVMSILKQMINKSKKHPLFKGCFSLLFLLLYCFKLSLDETSHHRLRHSLFRGEAF